MISRSEVGGVGSGLTSGRSASGRNTARATADCRPIPRSPHHRCCRPKLAHRLILPFSPLQRSRANSETRRALWTPHLPKTSAPKHCRELKPLSRTSWYVVLLSRSARCSNVPPLLLVPGRGCPRREKGQCLRIPGAVHGSNRGIRRMAI